MRVLCCVCIFFIFIRIASQHFGEENGALLHTVRKGGLAPNVSSILVPVFPHKPYFSSSKKVSIQKSGKK